MGAALGQPAAHAGQGFFSLWFVARPVWRVPHGIAGPTMGASGGHPAQHALTLDGNRAPALLGGSFTCGRNCPSRCRKDPGPQMAAGAGGGVSFMSKGGVDSQGCCECRPRAGCRLENAGSQDTHPQGSIRAVPALDLPCAPHLPVPAGSPAPPALPPAVLACAGLQPSAPTPGSPPAQAWSPICSLMLCLLEARHPLSEPPGGHGLWGCPFHTWTHKMSAGSCPTGEGRVTQALPAPPLHPGASSWPGWGPLPVAFRAHTGNREGSGESQASETQGRASSQDRISFCPIRESPGTASPVLEMPGWGQGGGPQPGGGGAVFWRPGGSSQGRAAPRARVSPFTGKCLCWPRRNSPCLSWVL